MDNKVDEVKNFFVIFKNGIIVTLGNNSININYINHRLDKYLISVDVWMWIKPRMDNPQIKIKLKINYHHNPDLRKVLKQQQKGYDVIN